MLGRPTMDLFTTYQKFPISFSPLPFRRMLFSTYEVILQANLSSFCPNMESTQMSVDIFQFQDNSGDPILPSAGLVLTAAGKENDVSM